MKKFVVSFLLLIFTLITGIWAFYSFEKPFDVFISPTGKYKVELYGNKGRPWFFTNTVRAKMYSGSEMFASEDVHYADFLDTSFEMTYQKFVWIDDDILSFRGIQNHTIAGAENGDSLLISNESNRKIRYMKIGFSVNLFLIFDLEPQTSRAVYINHSTAPTYIYAAGEFEGGEKIKFRSANFSEKSKKSVNGLFKYCVSVENNKVLIDSSQIEGFNTSPEETIPRAENCLFNEK